MPSRAFAFCLAALVATSCSEEASVTEPDMAPQERPAAGKITDSKAGTPAPDVTLIRQDGGPMSLVSLRGTPVLVNLWATWCAPCIAEMPALDRLAEEAGYDLTVVLVSQDAGGWDDVAGFLKRVPIAHATVLADPNMTMSTALEAGGLPLTVLYDEEGKEVWRVAGPREWDQPGGMPPYTAEQRAGAARNAELAAKGVRWIARGQEPGWSIDITPGGSVDIVADYGETAASFPTPLLQDNFSLRSGFRGFDDLAAEGHVASFAVRDEACADAMSGQPYPQTVELTVDGRTYRGCGGPIDESQAASE